MGELPRPSPELRPAKRSNVGWGVEGGGTRWEAGLEAGPAEVAAGARALPARPPSLPRRGAGEPTSAAVTRPSRPITGLHPSEAERRGRAGGRRSTTPSPVLAPPRAPLTCRGRSRAATAAGETTAHAHTSGSGGPPPPAGCDRSQLPGLGAGATPLIPLPHWVSRVPLSHGTGPPPAPDTLTATRGRPHGLLAPPPRAPGPAPGRDTAQEAGARPPGASAPAQGGRARRQAPHCAQPAGGPPKQPRRG